MKNLLKYTILCAVVMTTCFNCSVESIENEQFEESFLLENAIAPNSQNPPCSGVDPQARITNNGSVVVTLQIATAEGVVLHTVQDLAPGNSSSYLMFAEGNVIFNVEKNTTGLRDEKVVYTMNQCMSFDLEVDTDNYLTDATPESL
ncbi:hypothetical protein [Psychroserpens algicola]|uniref:hypothetical protein n=1 Tax=Psychroserpens algicola TaxID=1719034 RepID=UPI0019532AD7|nr:hypothetical protein [Psychroserpens algicola]